MLLQIGFADTINVTANVTPTPITHAVTYTSGDITTITFDLIGQFLAGITLWAFIIAILIMLIIAVAIIYDIFTGELGIIEALRQLNQDPENP